MEIYLVGGAVRDMLLGLPVIEKDWVVVGATPEEMLKLGYQPVGKDFPVFLHPVTHEEYALARTERKTGKGYKGFTFHTSTNVTLIEDLKRRDLTINAIAQSIDGQLIDPYNGQEDLKQGVLRHVSLAFQEDPVRILRIARFGARFPQFHVHSETLNLMKTMVTSGEVNALVAERVWQEFAKALASVQPSRFFSILQECGALAVLFPEILITENTLQSFENTIQCTSSGVIRLAVLLHNINENKIVNLCERYRIPKEYGELALLVNSWFPIYIRINKLTNPEEIYNLLKAVDFRRRPDRFKQFLIACDACSNFKFPLTKKFLKLCAQELQLIDLKPLQAQELKGSEFSQALAKLQLAVITHTQGELT